MKLYRFLLLLVGVSLLLARAATALAAVTITDLRCENRDNPLGIDASQPRLSWVLNSDERGTMQKSYRVLVASNLANLLADEGDLWDSGVVDSEQSIQLNYAGKSLASNRQCFWKVRVWDQNGAVSGWSQPAIWTMGILGATDWHAKWIGLDGTDETSHLAATDWIWFPDGEPQKSAAPGDCYFRRVVVIPTDREVRSARFVYTGDSECRGWLNGRDIGARNNYHTVKDNVITFRLDPGTNVIALTGYNKGGSAKPAGVVGRLEIEFDHGDPMIITTDSQWKVSREDTKGWNEAGFDDSQWAMAKDLGPVGMEPWGEVRVSESRRQPARWLRKEFSVAKKIKHATVSFSGLGLSELHVNGQKADDRVLSPAFAQYDKRVFYVTDDVTSLLREGTNALGVVLGNGRYYADRSKVYSGTVTFGWPKLLLQLRIEYDDGSVAEVVSDESWKHAAQGPILANNDFDGEEYDARMELNGWAAPGFDASQWQAAQLAAVPPGAVSAEMIEPIRVTDTLKPISVKELKPGVWIFDLGQNMVGWCRLHVKGGAGAQVVLRHAETLKPDGSLYMANLRGALATDIYTLKGGGEEIWEPRFISHGFRYVEITGFPGTPTVDSLEGRVVNSDLRTAGEFVCSNDLVNKIYTNVVWGVRGNYRSIPTDCPQRDERQGWLGDRSEESLGETYLFDNSLLYAKWMQDIADEQRSSGSVADVAPTYWPIFSDNVSWPSTGVIVPEMLRRQFGDTQTLATHYASAKKWMDFMSGYVVNGIIERDTYGDWCVPPDDPKLIHTTDSTKITGKALLATTYFYNDLRLMEGYARRLGKAADAESFHSQAEKMKTAFNEKFLNRAAGMYDNGTQTSCVLPLAFGLVPDDMHAAIFNHLVDKIEHESHGHIGTGLIGGQYLWRVLTDNRRPDLAYGITTQTDYPGLGYMVANGATTVWELWNGNTADPAMNSGNHVMLVGDLITWLYEDLAGIKADSESTAFKHIVMKPLTVGDLKFVQATHHSPYGLIASAWHKDGQKLDWRIEIPANTTATVYVPAQNIKSIAEDGRAIGKAAGVKFVRQEGDRAVLEIGSGKYDFRSED
jgi:alpha-L-rhamnosidase